MIDTRETLTFSSLKTYLNCRKKYEFRVIKKLVPISDKSEALFFGSIWHNMMEIYHDPDGGDISEKFDAIKNAMRKALPNMNTDDKDMQTFMRLDAMMQGYIDKWYDDFRVLSVEHEFDQPIFHPATSRKSRSFIMRGKVDGLVEMPDGDLYILEHKTADRIDGSYIEKLPMDFQTHLYAMYLSRMIGRPIVGVLYNVIQKTKIRRRDGWTDEEYKQRYEKACKDNNSGKSNLKQIMPETDLAFGKRLAEVYEKPEMYHREHLIISLADLNATENDIWELTQHILADKRSGHFMRNTDACFQYHRPCAYFPICRANDNQNVIDSFYTEKEPHSELSKRNELKTSNKELPF